MRPQPLGVSAAREMLRRLGAEHQVIQQRTGAVGSHAVRAAIERAQLVASLHGHVHESRGRTRLGRTICFNPGSDYRSGVLPGVLVKLSRARGVADYTFTTG